MQDIIQVDDHWYVSASSSHTDDRTLVIKQGDTFAIFNRYGDVQHIVSSEQGIYHQGTRYLSHFELLVNEQRPLLLNSTVKEDNSILNVDLTNQDTIEEGKLNISKDTLHIFRAKILWDGICYEQVQLVNYTDTTLEVPLTFKFAADFADIFEVRGIKRLHRGKFLPALISAQEVELGYVGLDGIHRRTRLTCSELPTEITKKNICFKLTLEPKGHKCISLAIACEAENSIPSPTLSEFDKVSRMAHSAISAKKKSQCSVFTSNEQFNDWLNRSYADLNMLITKTDYGPYPFAGIPWFSTPFGRDGIITALQVLWINPAIAKGVLKFLAATQAQHINPAQEAEPGKILHEQRRGEMATLGEIPYGQYYGTVDATPLFIMLAGKYFHRTGDRTFIESIWSNIEHALHWIDTYGDIDGDGFVEYQQQGKQGLVNQGWKDSNDAIFHQDGSAAIGPIALCEVQGYVYQAKLVTADFYEMFGELGCARKLRLAADKLKTAFNQKFWCEEISTFAIALDGAKKPCQVRSSNAGHALYCGIADDKLGRMTADVLLSDDLFSGWGVRTLAKNEQRYNPMSYHNGSVWPHDNVMIARGLARYGAKEHAIKILTGLFDASIFMDLHRLPELFCGFERRSGQGPILYPVACSPQAWASGTPFHLLQTILGMYFSSHNSSINFAYPQLPSFLEHVEINNLQFSNASVDLRLQRHPQDVGIKVLRKQGKVNISLTM